MDFQVYFYTCEFILLDTPTATEEYTVTALGVSCADNGMMGLSSNTECESAMPTIKATISDAKFIGDRDLSNRPAGCYYETNVFWNTNTGGACSTCRSVCKG